MSKGYDAIVIGSGIIGCAVAYEMAKSSKKVIVVEKNAAIGSGSTSSSCAIIRTHYSTVNGAALAKSNYPYWENWADYLRSNRKNELAKYKPTGCLVTCDASNGYGKKFKLIADELDIPYELWTPEQAAAKLPGMDTGRFQPVRLADDPAFGEASGKLCPMLFFPKAGYVSDPQLAAQNIAVAAVNNGAEFLTRKRVIAINSENNRVKGVILASGERISAPIVVNVTGPHSHKVNEMAGVLAGMNITTKALRVEVAHVSAPKGIDSQHAGFIGTDGDVGGYWRPEVGNNLLIGSLEPECDVLEWVDPDDFDTNLSEQARLQILRVAQRIPTLGIPNSVRGIVDLYDVTDDWIPIYDCSNLNGYYMAVGTSGNQFKNAPVVGMIMNALIDYCETGNVHDLNPMSFKLPNIDYDLDLSFCSRKRLINQESSFSVIG